MHTIIALWLATAAVGSVLIWRLLHLIREQARGHDAYCEEMRRHVADLTDEIGHARRQLRSAEPGAIELLSQIADLVERSVGHIDGAHLLERIAAECRQFRSGAWDISPAVREGLTGFGIQVKGESAVCIVATALELAGQLTELESRNLEVARMCQIVPFNKHRWLGEVMSRFERIIGSHEHAAKVLARYIQAWSVAHDAAYSAQVTLNSEAAA